MSEQLPSDNLLCSFCGKNQDEVLKLIAGPTAYICDECIDLCNDILAEEIDDAQRDEGESPVKPRLTGLEHIAACLVCRLPKLLEDMLTGCAAGPICRKCASAISIAVRVDAAFSLVERTFCGLCGGVTGGDLLDIAQRGTMCGTCVEAVLNATRARQT